MGEVFSDPLFSFGKLTTGGSVSPVPNRVVITVDGLAASGKSAVSRELARRLGFIHFSSGLLYRAVGREALDRGIVLRDEEAIGTFVEAHTWEVSATEGGSPQVLMDGAPLVRDLSDPQTSEAASLVGASRRVRRALVGPQQRAFLPFPLVAEGRDLGTVIFPDAPLKLFIDAPEEVRIARRIHQFYQAGETVSIADDELLRAEIRDRDRRDAERAFSPTVAAKDAVLVDNGARSLTEVVDYLYDLVRSRGLIAGS